MFIQAVSGDVAELLDSLGGLLPKAKGEDYEEEQFANRMKKKKGDGNKR